MKGMTIGYQFYDNLSKVRVIRFEFKGPPQKKFFFYPFPADFYLKSNTWLNIGMLYIKLFVMKFYKIIHI